MSDNEHREMYPKKIQYNWRVLNHRVEQDGDYRTIIIYSIAPPSWWLDTDAEIMKDIYPIFSVSKKSIWWKPWTWLRKQSAPKPTIDSGQ